MIYCLKERKVRRMIELGNLFAAQKEKPPVSISLFGKLEAIVGGYFLSEVTCGVFRGLWNSLYFDPSGQWERDGVKTIPENLIGYVDLKERWAFILERYREKFLGDTLEYSLSCIGVPSLDEEVLFCTCTDHLPEEFSSILWINDDFLSNERLPFDFHLFDLIEEGRPYLNPKHFSVKQLIRHTLQRAPANSSQGTNF